jgi:hypothetical protein
MLLFSIVDDGLHLLETTRLLIIMNVLIAHISRLCRRPLFRSVRRFPNERVKVFFRSPRPFPRRRGAGVRAVLTLEVLKYSLLMQHGSG